MNISEEEAAEDWHFRGSYEENIAFAAFYILVFVFAVPGNALALWSFYNQKSSSPSKVFLCHLAIADISYIILLPMRSVYHINQNQWPLGYMLCRMAGPLFFLNMYCSLYLMSLISLDRLLSVVLPIKSRVIRKAKYAKITVGILWVLVTTSMFPMVFSQQNISHNKTHSCRKLYLEKKSATALISTVVAFAIPLTCIVFSYILILLRVRSLKQRGNSRPVKSKVRKMVILIMMNFLIAFMPYHVSRVVYILSRTHGHVSSVTQQTLGRVNWLTSALTCVSGLLDPVMYFFLNTAFRSKVHQIFSRNGA
ncbi:uracil nucleotide/cysteinyl leukotriene receptor [Boleophthalmus pectinirostris]|uniref:uracil nucleotide/cysteinyl leukotriene receptor n=1 Tax=Boleophthalmus pectinirostris TaxID=150288 RepID=UPI00242E0837|nr:uracil nucleotide/cysteinyl leukotriene receptor [Boleophthalmus pectinirostris]